MVNNKKLFLIFSLILLFILPALSSAISFSDLFSFLGITSEEPEHHTVYLVSPGNNSYTNNNNDTLAFNFNHTGFLTGVVNCILYLDGTAVKYTTDVTADQNTAVYSNVSITETTHNWWVNCTNGTGGESSIDVGGNFTFTADYTPPHSINTCQDLTIENGSYILMQDISSSETCFTVGASNITLDCQGYTIDGNDTTSTYGVYVSDSAYGNGTIKNCVLTDWYYGVYVRYADNYSIINNTVESNWRGIQTHDSNNNFIAGNTVKYHPSSAAITLHASSGNMVINNTANSNSYGIFLYNNSDDNNIIGNTANSNTYSGFYLGDSSSNSLMNNTVQSNGDNGIGLLPGSGSNIIINNYASSNGGSGIFINGDQFLGYSNNNYIKDNIVRLNEHGIKLSGSDLNTIINTASTSNTKYGIYLKSAALNTINNSVIDNNTLYGIYVENSDSGGPNNIYNNLFNNTDNFYFTGTVYTNNWNTTNQTGIRIHSDGNYIGGNYWTNSTGNGYSDTCMDSNIDGFCDDYYNLTGGNIDWLPLSDKYKIFLTSCDNLNISGTTYILTKNVSSSGTCFNIMADNIILNGNGYTINYSQSQTGYGVNITNYDNITIKNLNILQSNESISNAHGIYNKYTTNTIISNNTINTYGSSNYGLYLQYFNANNVSYNKINTTCSNCDAIFSAGVTNSIIHNNILRTTNANSDGIYFTGSDNNELIANNIWLSGTSSHGIHLYFNTRTNKLINNTILVDGSGYGINSRFSIDTNNITGGSIISKNNCDYNIYLSDATNLFKNTNFTNLRKICFEDTTSQFNYNNETNTNIWLNTKISATTTLNRKLINWSQDQMRWNDTNSTTGITATYELTGLVESKNYKIYNTSQGTTTNSYNLTTDGSGKLSFTILLDGNTEILVNRTILTDYLPETTLNSPTDNTQNNTVQVTFNCSATDDYQLENITLYGNWSVGWHANETKIISGTSNSTTFTKIISEGTYLWNCLTTDNSSSSKFATQNYTFTIDTTEPSSITNLDNSSISSDWIYWIWTNPISDFDYVIIYLDGLFKLNTTNNFYNATELTNNSYYEISTMTVDDAGNINTTWVNSTVKTMIDNYPPGSIINLTNQSRGTTWIYWNWTNPTDPDFSHTELYLGGIWQINTSNNYYNATGLDEDTLYGFATRTVDIMGNVNPIWVSSNIKTLADLTPPVSITNLEKHSRLTDWIYWTWDNPANPDFDHVEIWLDGIFIENTGNSYYNATGLINSTEYELSTRTVDVSGNINTTWVNSTINTTFTDKVIVEITPQNKTISQNETFLLNVSVFDLYEPINGMEVKIYFNPAYISINSIAEGNLFTQDGAPTWFMTPIINNTEGSIINIVTSFLGSYNVSKPSNFITINLTAKETLGVSDINLTDIIISYPPDSDALYTFFKNGTITIIDTSAPSSIIGLLNQSKDQDWIYWNWTNPTDSDFSHTEIYINNTWKTNTSNNFYNATELIGDTTYEIQTRTVDNSGNVNTAWVNSSMMTAPDTIAPIITFIAPTNTTALTAGTTQTTINISTDENATCRYNTTVTNTSYENSTNFTTTGTTAHSFLYTGLTNGNTYNLYYWCNGTKGNIDQNAAHHTFSVSVALYCGDGTCNNGETCSTCATDCGSCSSSGGSSGGFIPTPIIPEDNTTENITVNNMTQVILQQNTTEDIIKQNDNMDKLEFKITAQDKIEAVKNMIKDIDTVARNILNDAEDAFAKGNYEEAYALASEAEIAIGAGTETSSTPKDHYPILEIIGFVFILMFYILILKKRRTLRRYIKSNINDYIQKRESINN